MHNIIITGTLTRAALRYTSKTRLLSVSLIWNFSSSDAMP